MITVDGNLEPEQPTTLRGTYELIEPYYLRTVRLGYEESVYDAAVGSYRDKVARTMGKLIGLSESSVSLYGSRSHGRDPIESISFFLEGQPLRDAVLNEFTLEVLQEDTREWITVYVPQRLQRGIR